MNKNAEELYNELTKRGKFFDTPEAFSQELQTEDGAKFYYDLATKEGLWMDTFDGFKNDVLDKKDRKLFPNASWDNLSWNNIKKSFGEGNIAGEVSQVAQSQAEEGIKKAEQERIRQEKINLGISDKDKQDVMELVELEQKAANPVSISASGVMEVRTPKPELNQYGMPTKVTKPVNPDIERQVETKKAQMPAYLTRGENTTMDIAQNAYDRAMNTEEGKNIITSIQNKYVSEFKQSEMYKALLKDFYAGKATEEDINNAFVEQYGQKMNDDIREGILGENGLMREYYDDASNKLEARLRARDAFDISSRIKAERDRQYEAFQNSIKSKRDENGINISVDIDAFKPDRMLNHAEQFNNDALDLIDAVNNERGFGKGIANALTDIDTFDMGLAELSRTKELIEILDKVEADEQLSEQEELMLDAALNYFAVTSYYSNKLGRGYKAGQTTGASLPFIAQFMLTSGALAGAEAAVEGGAKELGKKIVKNLVKHGHKKFAKALSSKAVTVPLATIGGLAEAGLEAGVMTSVFGIPKIEAGTQSRMLGEVNTTYNPETGEMEYLGRTNVQDEKTARRNATIDTYVEYLSEMVLAKAFDPVGEWLRSTNMYKNILRTDIAGAIVDAWSHPTWKSIRTSTKFGSLPEEILEEELGGLLRLGLASDVTTAKEAGLDLDSQIDIVLGLAPTSIMFGAVGAGTYYGSLRRNAKHIRQSLSSDAQRELFDKLMEESRSGQFGDLAHDMIRNIVLDNEMSVEDKKASITSIVGQYQDLLSQETQKLAQQVNETENAANIDEYISNTRNNASDNIYQTIDSKGRVCSIVDGRVEITQNEYGWNQVDQDKSSKKVSVRYRKEDGSLTEPIEILTSDLTAPVNVMNTEKFKEMALAKSLASTKGEDTFEYDGVVYDTTTGIAQGTVEEYAQKEEERKSKEEENNKNNEPRVNTRPHKINGVFTVTVNGKEVDVKVYSNNATQKTDGSIKGGTFSISVDGKVVTGERREMYVEALSEKLKADHAKAVEEYNQRKEEEVAAVEPIAEEPLVSEEDRAAAAAEQERMAKEAEKQAILANLPRNKQIGTVQTSKLSPEQLFVYFEDKQKSTELAAKALGSKINGLLNKISSLNPEEDVDKIDELQNEIEAYEAAIVKYAGQEMLDKINAARAEALQLDTPPVQEGAPVVAPVVEQAQGETPAPAEPIVPEQETPQDDVPAEPDTTPLPPAEPVDTRTKIINVEQDMADGNIKAYYSVNGGGQWYVVKDGAIVARSEKANKGDMPNNATEVNASVVYKDENGIKKPVILITTVGDYHNLRKKDAVIIDEYGLTTADTQSLHDREVKTDESTGEEIEDFIQINQNTSESKKEREEIKKYTTLDSLLGFPIFRFRGNEVFTMKDLLELGYRTGSRKTVAKQKDGSRKPINKSVLYSPYDLVKGMLKEKYPNDTDVEIQERMNHFANQFQRAAVRWNELVASNHAGIEGLSIDNVNIQTSSTGDHQTAIAQFMMAASEAVGSGIITTEVSEKVDTLPKKFNPEQKDRIISNRTNEEILDDVQLLEQEIENLEKLSEFEDTKKDIAAAKRKLNNLIKALSDSQAQFLSEQYKYGYVAESLKKRMVSKEQPKSDVPAEKGEGKTKETPAPAKPKTNIDSLRDAFVEAYARTQNQSYNALQKTTAKNAFKGMIDKMSEEDAVALYLNLAMESAKSQGKMQEDMVNAAQALLDSKHGAAINAITGGAQQETNQTPVESTEVATEETEQTAEDTVDYEALVAERNELQETIYDMEDDEAANANARINEINEILRNRAEFMVGDVVAEHAESTKRIIKILKAAGIRVVTFKNEDLPKYVSKKKLEELSDGQIVYGFASNDTIYLNEDHFNPNSPLHEFTHLWVTAYKQAFPNEWKRFVEIANKSALAANLRKPLQDGKDSPYAKLSADEMASEVLSRYTGYLYGELDADGRTAFENMMQAQTMEEKLAEKSLLKRIRDFWKKIISFFDKSIENEKNEETIDDMIRRFAQAPMETLARGREAVDKLMLNNTSENLDNSKKSSTFAQNNENYERNDERTMDGEVPSGSRRGESRTDSSNGEGRSLLVRDVPRANGGYDADVAQSVAEQSLLLSEMLTERGIKHTSQQVKLATQQEFYDAIVEAKQLNPHGWMVDAYGVEDYAGFTCLLTEDGKSGIAIKPNGDIISVFSSVKRDNRLQMLMPMAIMQGGRKLDCYYLQGENGNIYGLPKLYSTFGFKIAATTNFVEEYVPQEEYARWREDNNGSSIQGVAAMYISDEVANDLVNSYSISATPNTNAQNFPSADTGYGEALAERDKLMILENARANGTIGTINGKKSNLPDELWAVVRTDAFKDWFGDWQNDPANASKVLDENGEPLVVYHGSKMAGFDEFQQLDESVNGFFTTDNKAGANTYATNREERRNNVMADEAQLNAEPHHGIYSLFANIKNPAVYDFAGKMYNEYGEPLGYYVEMSGEEWDMLPVPKFATEEEALAFARENGEPDSAVKTTYLSTDDLVEMAKAAGHDGVIFKNVLDGAEHNEEQPVMNDYIVFEPNQLKSATQNIGTFNPEDNRIEFMIGPAGAPLDPMLFDAEAAAKIQIKTHKLLATFANPKANLPEEFSAMRELIATSLDRTEGIRWMMESIEKFRKEHGMPELGEGFDVRTMVEAMDSKIQNDTQAYINTTEKRLRKNIKKLADRVESSSFYKMHKIERELDQDGKEVELTALQMIERYLIACDSIEREQLNGNPRGLADFYRRMGMDVYEFAEAFNSAFFSSSKGKKQFDELWDSIRACTNVSIDMGWQSGLISLEEYTEYKKRRYYVPERDFAEVENNEELAIDSHGYRGKNSNKLTAMKQAKGGDSLAANVLANICLHARDGIIKSHRNAVKKAMFDLLRANEEWCREYKVPIPKQVWYQKNEDGTVSRMVDGPSAEDRKLMADLKSQIRDIENEIINLQQLADAATDESVKEAYENDIADLREQIDMLTDMFPYLDEFDTRSFIFMTNAAKNESTVMVYVDGVAQEMIFPNMSIIAKALNGTYNKEGEVGFEKSIGQYFAAGLTVYNPTFFTVNIVRDVPFIMKKGFAEYGFTFGARFIARMAEKFFNRELWKVVWNSDYKSLKDEHLREFFAGGANTGYTTIPEIRELKKQTKKWNDKKIIEWSDVKDLLSYMNTFSEVWTRSAAYSVVRDMGHTNEEAIKAAKNLSVNFNRKGLGNPFMNFFGSLSIFMNAAIQGACGYWRAFKGDEDTLPLRVWHGTRAAMQFMLIPAFTGFISTLLNPDDDKEKLYYSDYDRDNYALLGFLHEGIRIPLSEQVKPFWCMGVNIALGMQGRRTKEQITNSMVSTVVTNLLPLPPVLNSTIVMAANGLTGQKDFTPFQVIENMITPQALSGIYDLSNNVNFMGTDIRIEAGDRPQYMLGENEEYFCRQVAWWAYLISGGNRDYPSRTTTDGDKIWADWNPKQVSAVRNMLVPSTYRDVTDFFTRVVINAAYPDNPYHGEEAKWEDFATVRRFYKPRDREMGMYSITKDAKAIVKTNNERKANAQKLVKGGAITKNDAMRDEAELRLRQTLSNRDAKLMSEYITVCEQLSIRERAKEYGLTEKQFMDALRKDNKEVYKVLMKHNDVTREKAVDKLLQLTRKYKSISIEDMTLLEAFGVEE